MMNENNNVVTTSNIDSYYRYLGLNDFGVVTKKQSKLLVLTHILCGVISTVTPIFLGLLINGLGLFILTFIATLSISELVGMKIINKKIYKDFVKDFPDFDMTLSREYVKQLLYDYHFNNTKQEFKMIENFNSTSSSYNEDEKIDRFNKMASSEKIAFLEKEKAFYLNEQDRQDNIKEKKIGTIK